MTPRSAPAIRLLIGAATALGPGKVALLEAIGRTGSISAAARELGMSYRRAWLLVDTINDRFTAELVSTATGGKGGGGARLTATGIEVLRRYRAMEAKAQASIARDLAEFAGFMKDGPTVPASSEEE